MRYLLCLLFFCSSPFICEAKSGICLVMLIENDAPLILDCLKSVETIIDCAYICDMGSLDDTTWIIDAFLKDRGIPFQIFDEQRIDLIQNRTLCFTEAKKMLQKWDFSLEESYFLFLDPEMRLHISPSFQKKSLKEDNHWIFEESAALNYSSYKKNFFRASLPWASADLSAHSSEPITRLSDLTIEIPSIPEGKLEKKVGLLLDALEKNPHHTPYLFDLSLIETAQGRYQEALLHFYNCIHQGQSREDTWFCKFMIGQCYERLGEWDKALYWFLEAFQEDPTRGEPLHKMAVYYRVRGENEIACIFAKHGSQIPFYENPHLSPLPPLLDYQFNEELAVVAYYTYFKNEGEKANLQLLLQKTVPSYLRDQAYRNLLFYIQPLPHASYKPIEPDLPLIQPGFEERYHPMNPTIQKTKTGYEVICRSVNYTQVGAKIFNTTDPSGVFRSKNFLLHYDRDLNLQSQSEIIENLPRHRVRAFNLEGLDDCRLIPFQDHSWFTCTTSDTNPFGNFQISLCRLSSEQIEGITFVDKLVPLMGPDPNRCEKNWLPFVLDGSLHAVYSYDPWVIYRIDSDTGHCEKVQELNFSLDLSRFRGSAAPIPWKEGYLLLVHEVVFHLDYQRTYIHRFLFLDQELHPKSISSPFYFQHQGIEFCCGMQVNHDEDTLILTIGDEDREAYFCQVPVTTVQSLLKPITTQPPSSL